MVATTFMRLRVAAAFWSEQGWHVLAETSPNVMLFESGHGHAPDRYAHNARSFARVKREGKPVLAENAGFSDFSFLSRTRKVCRRFWSSGRSRPVVPPAAICSSGGAGSPAATVTPRIPNLLTICRSRWGR